MEALGDELDHEVPRRFGSHVHVDNASVAGYPLQGKVHQRSSFRTVTFRCTRVLSVQEDMKDFVTSKPGAVRGDGGLTVQHAGTDEELGVLERTTSPWQVRRLLIPNIPVGGGVRALFGAGRPF